MGCSISTTVELKAPLLVKCTGIATCSASCSIYRLASSLASLEPSQVEMEALGEGHTQESDQLVH